MSPQDVLISCMESAERIKDIVVIVNTTDGYYESWSNKLDLHERIGLMEVALTRAKMTINAMVDDKS